MLRLPHQFQDQPLSNFPFRYEILKDLRFWLHRLFLFLSFLLFTFLSLQMNWFKSILCWRPHFGHSPPTMFSFIILVRLLPFHWHCCQRLQFGHSLNLRFLHHLLILILSKQACDPFLPSYCSSILMMLLLFHQRLQPNQVLQKIYLYLQYF